MNKYDSFSVKDATHLLKCVHGFDRVSKYHYHMDCIILKEMPDGERYKVLVFGDRFWKHESREKKKRIRYVEKWRVVKKKEILND